MLNQLKNGHRIYAKAHLWTSQLIVRDHNNKNVKPTTKSLYSIYILYKICFEKYVFIFASLTICLRVTFRNSQQKNVLKIKGLLTSIRAHKVYAFVDFLHVNHLHIRSVYLCWRCSSKEWAITPSHCLTAVQMNERRMHV